MLGAIIGDIVGSIYEFANIKTKDFPFFSGEKEYTDDSVLCIATADWLLHGGDVAEYYYRYASKYKHPMGGYGTSFWVWVLTAQEGRGFIPYHSCGNGSAMRIAPVGWLDAKVHDLSLVVDEILQTKRTAEQLSTCTVMIEGPVVKRKDNHTKLI